MKEFENATSPTGQIIVFVERLMEEYARRDDGAVSTIRQDIRFNNHAKMTTTGIVVAGTKDSGTEVVGDLDMTMPRSAQYHVAHLFSSAFDVEINKGDRVWFHYLAAENKALIQPISSGGFYVTMNSADVFCQLPGDNTMKELIWNFMYCAGDQIIEDERKTIILDAHGHEIKAKVKPSQGLEIVVGLFANPQVNECKIWGIGKSKIDDISSEVKAGDHVYLSKDCEFQNYIQNHSCWVFKHSDILGHVKRNPQDTIPVGKFHLVKINVDDYKTEMHRAVIKEELTGHNATLINKRPRIVIPSTGKIISSGGLCKHGAAGDKALFSIRWMKMLDRGHWLVHDNEIQAIL